MKKILCAFAAALAWLAVPQSASAAGWQLPYRVDAGANVYFRVIYPGQASGAQVGPWYLYWPLEAHFQQPAPYGNHYPYWPSPMTLPQQFPGRLPAPIMPPAVNGPGR